MDSGNSGSLQSSSGGADEEYDSRTESISSFLNPSLLQPPPPPPSNHHQPPPSFFDPPPFSHSPNPNPVFNLDPLWSRNIRPDPSFTEFGSTPPQTTLLNSHQAPYPENPGGAPPDHHHQVPKNPKKRTRASRRAPTTVLTTDTTNFRQMVQEFTGIPAAPFSTSASSSTFSRRLDLLGVGGGGGIGPLYPLRPSAQKIPPPQPSYLNSATASSSSFQLPPSDIHEFPKQPQTLINLQNPAMFSFQSLLPSQQPEHPSQFPSSSKRWRGQDENLMSFEGVNSNTQNVGGPKLTRSGSDQAEGNLDSWICPSD